MYVIPANVARLRAVQAVAKRHDASVNAVCCPSPIRRFRFSARRALRRSRVASSGASSTEGKRWRKAGMMRGSSANLADPTRADPQPPALALCALAHRVAEPRGLHQRGAGEFQRRAGAAIGQLRASPASSLRIATRRGGNSRFRQARRNTGADAGPR
jgi:hypothetical protein